MNFLGFPGHSDYDEPMDIWEGTKGASLLIDHKTNYGYFNSCVIFFRYEKNGLINFISFMPSVNSNITS
jgi:hypothetical protein